MAEILSKDRHHQEEEEPPLELKQGSKVFSKLFSRDSSAAAPSFRVYYGVASAGSVPFLWESQPGTPKNDAVSAATLPPLTPPPSYYTATATHRHKSPAAVAGTTTASATAGDTGGKNKHGFFSALLPKIILRHHHQRSRSSSSSPTSSSSSSSSFRSAQSSSAASSSSMRSRVFAYSAGEEDRDSEEEGQEPATCFRVRHESFRALKSCRVATTVRTALASVGGHGHGGTTAAQRV